MIRCLIAGVAVLLVSTVALAQSPPQLEAEPPPGFEDLLAPQTTLVDVIYRDRVVGTALATFKPGELVFANPADVVALLLDVGDHAAVARALTGPLATMSDRLCGRNRTSDCGDLEPTIAGIIFDESRFQV